MEQAASRCSIQKQIYHISFRYITPFFFFFFFSVRGDHDPHIVPFTQYASIDIWVADRASNDRYRLAPRLATLCTGCLLKFPSSVTLSLIVFHNKFEVSDHCWHPREHVCPLKFVSFHVSFASPVFGAPILDILAVMDGHGTYVGLLYC